MATLTTRAFSIADYDAALAVWNAVEGLEICEGDSREEIARYLQRNPGISRVAVLDGMLVGAVLGGHDGRRGWIYHLAVAPEHRGRGIARRLIQESIEELHDAGIRRAIILVSGRNKRGHEFWISNGWEDITGATAMSRDV